MLRRRVFVSVIVPVLLAIVAVAVVQGQAQQANAPTPAAAAAAAAAAAVATGASVGINYCNNTTPDTEAEEFLNEINNVRTNVLSGLQSNGNSGKLPVATNMQMMNWSCELGQQALDILKNETCQANLTAPPPNNSYFYKMGDNNTSILTELQSIMALGNSTPLNTTENGTVFYRGEPDVDKYASLIRESATEIGCAQKLCENSTDQAILCMTDQPPLKDGDVVYEGVANACPKNDGNMTNSIRKAFLSKHNSLRSMLAMGTATKSTANGRCRPAKKMPELVYDCELERTAYEEAKLCSSKTTTTTTGTYQENSWKVTRNPPTLEKAATLAVQRWWSEIKSLDKQFCWTRSTYWTSLGVDAFARVASEQTTKVGCGIHNCTSDNMILAVCHYQTNLKHGQLLYTLGTKVNYCKDCPPPSECAASLPALCTSLATDGVKLY